MTRSRTEMGIQVKTRASALALAMAMAAACSPTPPASDTPQPTATPTATAAPTPAPEAPRADPQQLDVIKKFMAAVSEGTSAEALIAENAVLTYSDFVGKEGDGRRVGRDAILKDVAFQKQFASDFSARPVNIFLLEPNRYLVESLYAGTHDGAVPGGPPPTGKRFGYQIVHVITFEGNLMTQVELWLNQMVGPAQLGFLPWPGAHLPVVPEITAGEPTIIDRPGPKANLDLLKQSEAESHLKHSTAANSTLFAPDFRVDLSPDPRVDLKSYTANSERMMGAFSDEKIVYDGVYSVGTHAIVMITHTATHTGPVGEIPATNKTFTRRFIDIAEIVDGRIAHLRHYSNPLFTMKELGLLPPPGPPKNAAATK